MFYSRKIHNKMMIIKQQQFTDIKRIILIFEDVDQIILQIHQQLFYSKQFQIVSARKKHSTTLFSIHQVQLFPPDYHKIAMACLETVQCGMNIHLCFSLYTRICWCFFSLVCSFRSDGSDCEIILSEVFMDKSHPYI